MMKEAKARPGGSCFSVFQLFSISVFIPKQVIEEKRVVGEVAFEEAAGFHGEAVGPFEAEFLEGGGRLFDLAGVEGEGGADAEIDGGWELVFVFGDPVFLFRAAEADPDQVGAGGEDLGADRSNSSAAIRRRVASRSRRWWHRGSGWQRMRRVCRGWTGVPPKRKWRNWGWCLVALRVSSIKVGP
jgi:hypothetical protein